MLTRGAACFVVIVHCFSVVPALERSCCIALVSSAPPPPTLLIAQTISLPRLCCRALRPLFPGLSSLTARRLRTALQRTEPMRPLFGMRTLLAVMMAMLLSIAASVGAGQFPIAIALACRAL